MSPRQFAPTQDFSFLRTDRSKPDRGILYHNNGDGTFSDVTRASGLAAVKAAHSFTPLFEDFNNDGKVDLFIANDSDPNLLFLNQGERHV